MHEIVNKATENGPESTLEKSKSDKFNKHEEKSKKTDTTTQQSHQQKQQSQKQKKNNDLKMENAEGSPKRVAKGEGMASSGSSHKNGSSSAAPSEEKKTDENETSKNAANGVDNNAASAAPPPPVMRGTLTCDLDHRRHLIRGNWNYENSDVFPPQPFELIRNLEPDEEREVLPKNGVFSGSFRLAYVHTTSKGKRKERFKTIPETGVHIKFTKIEGKEEEYKVDGKGTNQFGIFHINGTATRSTMKGDNSLHVILRKRYETAEPPLASNSAAAASTEQAPAAATISNKTKVIAARAETPAAVSSEAEVATGPLPEPSQSYASGVVCLRGKVYQEESADLGLNEFVQRINGMWSSGLDFILADPQNLRGLCNRFEYEHKSSQASMSFPVSGRYSGWFDLSNEDGTRTRINERDVTLKFRKNNAGFYNVEGKGSNVFGKYSITGTVTLDHVITIFRHFQPRKLKVSKSSAPVEPTTSAAVVAAPEAAPTPTGLTRRPSTATLVEAKLKLDDVRIPEEGSGAPPDPITPPANALYSAVSRGVLRVNSDGSHSCQGKWAATRDHFTNGQTSNFNFRLETHFAAEALAESSRNGSKEEPRQFPLDSAMYKGSFQLKKGTRSQTIVDQQVVMKFRQNNQGSYNVHGKGLNAIGEFDLIGTMIMSGKTGGQVELYRMYPPEKLSTPAPKPGTGAQTDSVVIETAPLPGPDSVSASIAASTTAASATAAVAPPVKQPGLQQGAQRRESTRLVKLPSRLEDDDPSAQLSRIMEKCAQVLRIISDRDRELGAFFSEPVDPVALRVPTYHQVIKEPMDLGTVNRRMEAGQITTPEEFSRLVRLVFENAMTFNVDPTHSVHQAARNLLVLFNQKFRDVERMVQNIRRTQGSDWDDRSKKKGKDEKKRKRLSEEPKSLKRRRLEEAQEMAAANASAVAAIVAAAPPGNAVNVTRSEFNMLLHLLQQLQQQVVQTHTALAELCPGDETDVKPPAAIPSSVMVPPSSTAPPPPVSAPAPAPEPPKKKVTKRKSEVQVEAPAPVVDDSAPLTLEEQELLTETINELPQEHLGGVIQIIREAAPVGADEDEIDLEIDQLDTRTQRKLLAHVSKFVKKSKNKVKKKQAPTTKTPPAKKAKPTTTAAPKPKPAASSNSASDPFFTFNKDDSESEDDSDSENEKAKPSEQSAPSPKSNKSNKDDDFQLTTADHHDDDEHDDDEDGLVANWNMKTTAAPSVNKNTDEDDAWGAAREQAAVNQAREAERKAREEKMKAEAEKEKQQRLLDVAAQLEELKAKREAEEAENEKKRQQKEKEEEKARKEARERAQAEVRAVEQTIDLDIQREIMKEYEEKFLDNDYGGGSPSSDFGF